MIVKLFVVVSLAVCTAIPAAADDRVYDNELQAWRESREKSLRADNGWLTLAGRFPLKSGTTRSARAKTTTWSSRPNSRGSVRIDWERCTSMRRRKRSRCHSRTALRCSAATSRSRRSACSAPISLTGWASRRLRMHIIMRDGRYILRLARQRVGCAEELRELRLVSERDERGIRSKRFRTLCGQQYPIVNVVDEVS